jgi:DNA repair exonuclease SbcCD ATPase subunit
MRIVSVVAENFASYKKLRFNFDNQGLCLIQGATGSGKSTLCDVIPWCLFGHTSKGGTVDEIISWNSTEPTMVSITFDDDTNITRIRGHKAKDNDLCIDKDEETIRGKDLNDTQKIINSILGMTCDVYLAGAYYHEFSQTAQFFSTTAKNRRALCEQLVDLKLAKNLQLNVSEKKKEIAKDLSVKESQINTLRSKYNMLIKMQATESIRAEHWEAEHKHTINNVSLLRDKFESNRKRIISNSCSTCGTVLSAPKEVIDTTINPHATRLEELKAETSPYTEGMKDYTDVIRSVLNELETAQGLTEGLVENIDDLETLEDVIVRYRVHTIESSIKLLENKTNELLAQHFDSEIKVEFLIEDADKLEVTILKDGCLASFTQLSKGQRCVLKLCFGGAVMQVVQNHHGIDFEQLFFDEALSGCDDNMKVKAFGMLEELSQGYDSVYVVEHSSAMKECFSNKYEVELINGHSVITKA